METTDLHMHILPYDYYNDRVDNSVGLSRLATLIEQSRTEFPNTLLFDNGDFLQGTPMGDYLAFEHQTGKTEPHPMIAAMNALQFDAATLGNHEFNYGLSYLEDSIADAGFPIVSANVLTTKGLSVQEDTGFLKPYVILDRSFRDKTGQTHLFKIGVIGFTPPQIVIWDKHHLKGRINTRDIIEAARVGVPEMKAAGADLIIALNHSGIAAPGSPEGMENAGVALAAVEGIDVLLCGHQHLLFPETGFPEIDGVDTCKGTILSKPAVMAGAWGSHLGVIDLELCQARDGWNIQHHDTAVHPIAERQADRTIKPLVSCDPKVLAAASEAHNNTLSYIRQSVGHSDVPLHSYFSRVAFSEALDTVCAAQAWYVKEMLSSTEHGQFPILSATAPFKAGGRGGPGFYTDIGRGEIAIRNIADLYLYPNTIRASRISGRELRNWLERAASAFCKIQRGIQKQPLLNPDFPAYNFDVIQGVTYQIDPSEPPRFSPDGFEIDRGANRISNLKRNGRPVSDTDQFIIATNNFRAEGAGHFPGTGQEKIIFRGPDTIRDILIRFFRKNLNLSHSLMENWCFTTLPETAAYFDSSPQALKYTKSTLGITPLPDHNVEGFQRYRISFATSEKRPIHQK